MAHPIIDSHIHLWPASAANPEGHAWMSVVTSLAKQQVLSDYTEAATSDTSTPKANVQGVIYIETDRRYTFSPNQTLETWAKGPLDEIKFLKSIVEGEYGAQDAEKLLGLVPWAPVDRGVAVFEEWLSLAQKTAGQKTWDRVKGFRFLLQAIHERDEFEKLVLGDDFFQILRRFTAEGRDFAFDVGIDAHGGGQWQLETWVKVLARLNGEGNEKPIKFVMNHLCKPDLTHAEDVEATVASEAFKSWQRTIKQFANYPRVYMKLSGAFSELSTGTVDTTSAVELARRLRPWTDTVFDAFGPSRVMFGSDWPVCNIRGPAGEESWPIWTATVQELLKQKGVGSTEQRQIWSETAKEAYNL